MLLLLGCQSEINQISDNSPEAEPIAPNSTTAQAMKKAAALDGSSDNIIDGTSCLSVVYPVNVIVNGISVTISGKSDLSIIEGIFDLDIEDDDTLEIEFPITVRNQEHIILVINNEIELEAAAASCEEGGVDFDNECIDFSYPLTFFVFNTISESTSRVIINNDKDLYIFVNGFNDDSIVSLDYPVTLIKHDNEIITVNNNIELTTAIESADEGCDEDDDNNFEDDDFEEGEFEAFLKQCPWEIKKFKRNDANLPFSKWSITFYEDGTLQILDDKEVSGIDGNWTVNFMEEGTYLKLDIGTVPEFSFEWKVNKVDDNTIFVYSSPGDFMKLDQKCEDNSSVWAEGLIIDKKWKITLLQASSPQDETDYIAFPLDFNEDGKVSLFINGVEKEGTWQYVTSDEKNKFRITFQNQPSLSQAWNVESITETEIKLRKDEKRLELKKVDENEAITGLQNLRSWLQTGPDWSVSSLVVDGIDVTVSLQGIIFNYEASGLVNAVAVAASFEGGWFSYADSGAVILEINFPEIPLLASLTDEWEVVTSSESQIILKKNTGAVNKTLILER